MVQTSLSVQTKVLLVSAAAVATGLAAYALGYYDYDWRLMQGSDQGAQQQQQLGGQQQPLDGPVLDGAGAGSGAIDASALTLTSDPRLPDATAGRAYETQLTSSAGANTRWILEQGALPSGLELDQDRGIIRGTANALGQSIFRLKFVSGGDRMGISQFTLNVVSVDGVTAAVSPDQSVSNNPPYVITTHDLPSARVGVDYKHIFTVTGGPSGVRSIWSATQGTVMPPGINFSSDGVLRGTPTQAGRFQLAQLSAVPEGVNGISSSGEFFLDVLPAAVVPPTPLTPPTPPTPLIPPTQPGPAPLLIHGGFPDGGIGGYYSARQLEVSGGQPPYEWMLAGGNLPTGFYVSPNGQIAGYANQYGIFTFTLQVRDQANRATRAERTIHIRPAQPVISASLDPDLSNRLRRIDLMGVQVHDLVKLQDDSDPNTQFDTTVYYIGADGRRHSFPNPKVYFSWFPDFSRVRTVAPRELADIPLGANLTYRPGTRMVKFMTDLRVYAVDADRRLRWVKTEGVAQVLYGPFWARQVDDVSDAFYGDYRFGQDINQPGDYSLSGAQGTAAFPSDVLPR